MDLGPMGDMLQGMAAAFGGEEEAKKMELPSFSGLTLATGMEEKAGGGSSSGGGGGSWADGFPALFALPVIALVAAGVNTKKGYITVAILGAVLFVFVMPAGQGAAMLKKEIGWFATVAGLGGMFLTALMLPAAAAAEPELETAGGPENTAGSETESEESSS